MESARISKTLMRRLPLYLEYLRSLPGEDRNISATAIAGALGLGEVQVRKDLAKIAGEGRCRTGRSRDQLIRDVEEAVNGGCETASIFVGSGMLGQTLIDSGELAASGVHVLACFELNPTRKRTECGLPVYSINRLESFCRHYDVSLGIIAVPMEKAQSVCDGLIACGIQKIWNCSTARLTVPKGIRLQSNGSALPGIGMGMDRWPVESA